MEEHQGTERTCPNSCAARWHSALPDRSSYHPLEIRTRPTSSSTSRSEHTSARKIFKEKKVVQVCSPSSQLVLTQQVFTARFLAQTSEG